MSESKRILRCAIYTRKSTEEGLEQEFNSLQAQRESGEAYILSQKQNRWELLPKVYDDGGFSGASLERPALQQLLEDIERRQIDCVVVYKVDRLSRSLLDFARLLSLFEKRSVSFVSVTQEFNTTTSMGRLTLNILLSFAQFEREIISERTRDKMSEARRKGKWVGGTPVLGYDVAPQGGRLMVNGREAAQVREIFTLAARCQTVVEAVREVNARGFTTKSWTSQRGQRHGGNRFSSSTLILLLRNVLYRGDVSHKGTIYPGEQEALLSRELWAEVNQKLKLVPGPQRQNRKIEALLKELLWCGQCGERLIATYTRKMGQRHLYYVCRAGKKRTPRCEQRPVAAVDLDSSLLARTEPILGVHASNVEVQQALQRVTYESGARQVSVELRDGGRFEYALPYANRRGVRGGTEAEVEEPRGRVPRVSRLMALAIQFQQMVRAGTVKSYRELAEVGHVSRPRLCHIMKLANLAPSIQERLFFLPRTVSGPDGISDRHLRSIAGVVDWDVQRERFEELLARVDGQ